MNCRLMQLAIVLAMLLSLVGFQVPTHAAAPMTARVMTFRLNVRIAASIRAAKSVVLKADDVVTVLGQKKTKDAWHVWFKIRTTAGKTGWVASSFVKLLAGKIQSVPILP
jgi:hypothetical protein